MKNFKDKQKWGEKFNSIDIYRPASTTVKSWPGLFLLYFISLRLSHGYFEAYPKHYIIIKYFNMCVQKIGCLRKIPYYH